MKREFYIKEKTLTATNVYWEALNNNNHWSFLKLNLFEPCKSSIISIKRKTRSAQTI